MHRFDMDEAGSGFRLVGAHLVRLRSQEHAREFRAPDDLVCF